MMMMLLPGRQEVYTGDIEDQRRLLIKEGHRLRLPQQRQPLHPSDPAAAIPKAAWAPLDALLAAAQRLVPGLRPSAAELAEGFLMQITLQLVQAAATLFK